MTQAPERRLPAIGFIVDTNCVNSRQQIEALNQLEQWSDNDLFQMLTTEVAQNEMLAGSNAVRTAKAYGFIFTMSSDTTEQEFNHRRQIERILFPAGATTKNENNDVEIVFNAGKYVRTLITTDGASKSQPGGILGHRAELAAIGIKVMSPAEAVTLVRDQIAFRDEYARRWATVTASSVPDWVGKD